MATAEVCPTGSPEPPLVIYDRRKSPDRRTTWRGGRRDSDWTTARPPGALRRFDSLQRRVVQFGKWRVPLPFTSTTRRVHPLLGLWALLIVVVMTYAAAKTNYVLLEVLYETVARPASTPQPASADDYIVVNV